MNKPKSWHTCRDCGMKFFQEYDPSKDNCYLIIMYKTCPDCGKETIIPLYDFDNNYFD